MEGRIAQRETGTLPRRGRRDLPAPRAVFAALLIALGLTGCSERADIRDLDRSVVRIQHVFEYQGKNIPGAHGTGFVLNDQGYVVTNNHVVNVQPNLPPTLKTVSIFVPDGSWSKRLEAKIVWTSDKYDLALLHVPGLKRPGVALANVKPAVSPEKGEAVFAIGFPGAGDVTGSSAALESTVTNGTVSKVTLGRGTQKGVERMIVQHSATINLGNSGGPLFNACGQVIAVNTFAATSTFRIVRRPDGQVFARGSAVSGVYYSPHVSTLIQVLTTEPKLRDIRFRSSAEVCVPASETPIGMYVSIALVAALAAVSIMLALVRKRGPREVVRVVETYSQWIRRRGGQPAGPVARSQTGTPTRQPARPAVTAPPPEMDGGWVLQGVDAEGAEVRLAVGRTELSRASSGSEKGLIVGRSNSLSNKVLTDGSVSRRHARLVDVDGKLGIEDLNSTFGTMVNGEAITPYNAVPLHAGTKITLGDVVLEVAEV